MYKNDTYVEASSDEEPEQHLGAPAGITQAHMERLSHMKTANFKNVLEIPIDIDITCTPAELAQNPSLRKWKLASQLHKEFKQNLATVNRHLATEDQLVGDVKAILPLGFEIVSQMNTFPYSMGIKNKYMMDRNLHRTGKCLWRVWPDTQNMSVGREIFKPVSIVDAHAYKTSTFCTPEALKSDVKKYAKTAKAPAHARVTVGTLAYDTLVGTLMDDEMVEAWESEIPHVELEHILNPGRDVSVQVTEKMADDIIGFLKPKIDAAVAGFINVEDFEFDIFRADGHSDFTKQQGIHGQMIGGPLVNVPVSNEKRLEMTSHFGVKAILYCLPN